MVDFDRLSQQMRFIVEIDKLKHIERQSALTDGTRQENDSEHSWHIAAMAFLLSEYSNTQSIDLLKVIKMLLIHDLVEIDAGDTFLYDAVGNSTKAKREKKAAARIFGLLPDDQAEDMLSLWTEFEARETPEAKFAFAMDAIQPLILSYHNRGWSWKKHGIVKSQIVDKKKPLKIGSEDLWEYAQRLIKKAIDEGFLIDDEAS
ncbi:MAG: HD domain-containing protein [Candidatus Thorarchaeota archaeon]